jgi:membrane protease subunit HflK
VPAASGRCRTLVALWTYKSVYTVQPDELGVELLFGKPKTELSMPGLHFHFWPIETVEIANTAEKLVNIGESIRPAVRA